MRIIRLTTALITAVGMSQARSEETRDWAYPYPAMRNYLDETYQREFEYFVAQCRNDPAALTDTGSKDFPKGAPEHQAKCLEEAVMGQIHVLFNGNDANGDVDYYQQTLTQMAATALAMAELALPGRTGEPCDCTIEREELQIVFYTAMLIEMLHQTYRLRSDQGR